MKSNITLSEISNGRLYDYNDMVRADAGGCNGCSACCHGIGDDVTLNPQDVYAIRKHLSLSFDELIDHQLSLKADNKLLLPFLRMTGEDDACSFLSEEKRCSIHSYRPDICRLFPLGRVYENDSFHYFLQSGACVKPKLEKVKVKKWIGIEDYPQNKTFIIQWYQFVKALNFRLKFVREEAELQRMQTYVLDTFYRFPLESVQDFYAYFNQILPESKSHLDIL